MESQESKKIFFIENESCESLEFDPKDFYDVTLPANDRVQKLIDDFLSDEIKLKAGINGEKLEALSYKSDFVVGTNYFVKVRSQDKYVHVRIFLPFPYQCNHKEVTSVLKEKNQFDSVEHFQFTWFK
ncbi:cystatin B [Brachionus plicatilis]|uniref:Cystatin B n=1 Tax=Brachionus plicatilis TaxID=10195 RepID=A0A3M7R9P7_BRAPC|nr:cystatin B [Brachionus plicatilis]